MRPRRADGLPLSRGKRVAGHFGRYYIDSHRGIAFARALSPVTSRRRAVAIDDASPNVPDPFFASRI